MIERIPKSPPKIEPLGDDIERPLWSVMIPSYNCIQYLREAILSVLEQAPSAQEMQIEVIDDSSTDGDVEALVRKLGNGRIGFFRHPQNIGHYRNFEFCINRAKGKLIHVLHGDDIVKPGFYEEIASLFNKYPSIGGAFTRCMYFDENSVPSFATPHVQDEPGIVNDFLLRSAHEQLYQSSATVVKRSVYEHVGTIYGELYGEDLLLAIRIASHYDIAYSPKSLACYRVHTTNLTSNAFATGQNIKGIKANIESILKYLPREERKSLKSKAKRHHASYITTTVVNRLYHDENKPKIAFLQAWGIFKFYPSIDTFCCLFKISVKRLIRY